MCIPSALTVDLAVLVVSQLCNICCAAIGERGGTKKGGNQRHEHEVTISVRGKSMARHKRLHVTQVTAVTDQGSPPSLNFQASCSHRNSAQPPTRPSP